MKIFWARLSNQQLGGQDGRARRARKRMLSLPCARCIHISSSGQHFIQATLSPSAPVNLEKHYTFDRKSVFVGGGRLFGKGVSQAGENEIESGGVFCDTYFSELTQSNCDFVKREIPIEGEIGGVFWDSERNLAHVQRDYFGTVPIYYISDASSILISNHLDVLLSSLEKTPRQSETRLIDWIQGYSENNHLTAFEDVLRLPAGHRLIWKPGEGSSITRYYDLGKNIKRCDGNFDQVAEQLRFLLKRAIVRRLEADGKVASELSGGLDSSAIVALTAQSIGPRLMTFSAVYPEYPVSDESKFVQAVVEKYQCSSYCFDGASLDIVGSFRESLKEFRDFHYAGNIHIPRHILQKAVESECVQVLNGIDGDNVASHGLFLLQEFSQNNNWFRFGRTVHSISDLFASFSEQPDRWLFRAYGEKQYATICRDANPVRAALAAVSLSLTTSISLRWLVGKLRRFRAQSNSSPEKSVAWRGPFNREDFNPEFLTRTDFESRAEYRHGVGQPETEQDAQIRALSYGINEHYFELIHALSAARGISTVCPFMDKDLIEFCIGVPAKFKLRNGWNRAFLRQGLRNDYPRPVASKRTKSNLGPSVARTIREKCVPQIQGYLMNPSSAVWNVYEQAAVRKLLERIEAPHADKALEKLWIIWTTAEVLQIRSLN